MDAALVGGHAALDFANTTAWRLDEHRAADRVPDAAALVRWAVASGLVDEAEAGRLASAGPAAARRAAQSARRLRTALHHLLDAAVDATPPDPADLATVRHAAADAWRHVHFGQSLPLRPGVPVTTQQDVVRRLALAAVDVLSGPLDRLRRCQGPGCGWFFLDRSRNQTRQWCRTDDCGNRARARRHYARTHTENR